VGLNPGENSDSSQIDIITLEWAVHSMSGIVSPANSAYSAEELTHQLKDAGAKVLFTCAPLIPLALKAAADAGIPKNRIYLFKVPDQMMAGQSVPKEYKTVDQLIEEGSKEPKLEKLKWTQGQGARQTAYLCYSSGTSGLPVSSKNRCG
jgi:acyl-CoA synthetase (AMP-forming)/AMP-acid ligase II